MSEVFSTVSSRRASAAAPPPPRPAGDDRAQPYGGRTAGVVREVFPYLIEVAVNPIGFLLSVATAET
jgi:hypothetical protein